MIKIVFLGTQGMQPTKERGLPSIYVQFGQEKMLVDCGEGTQRQMRVAGLKPAQLTKIFISHFHADHVLGLAGMMRNLAANDYSGTLEIYGPKGLETYYHHLTNSSFNPVENVKVRLIEIKEGILFEDNEFMTEVKHLAHSVPSYGINIIEKPKRKMNMSYLKKIGLTKHPLLGELQRGKDIVWRGKKITVAKATYLTEGKKITFIQDTAYHDDCVELAKEADLLISESTFEEKEREKAQEYKHLTSRQAALIAKKARAKRLILTHFSQRYKDVSQLQKEAKAVFKNVICAKDFDEVEI
ncbi:ribonuclease Z [Candidatus Woesearchaeota archaeon]|nr:ribonuclease Z [Candidatus Woesearchaeota archaeon]